MIASKIRRFLPLALILILMAVLYFSNLHHLLSLETIKKEQFALKNFAHNYPLLSPLIFIGIYILSVCLIIPDSTLLTLIGGLIFPLPLAIFYTAISETIGAWLFFLIIEDALGTNFIKKERAFLAKMRKNFTYNAASYLLFLRLSHILPFWFINTLAAYFRLRTWTFIWTTFLGVLPLTYVLSQAGHRLSDLFASGESITLKNIFNTEMKIALFLLGAAALIPLAYKKWKKK